VVLAAVGLLAGSCILDPKKAPPKKGGPIGQEYRSLKEKDDVLINLQLAYNDRNISQYDKLLDDDFIFIFSQTDWQAGKTPRQWDRTSEIRATTNMFSRNPTGKDPITSLSLHGLPSQGVGRNPAR